MNKLYTHTELGTLSSIAYKDYRKGSNFKLEGKVFLNELLELTSCEISMNTMKAHSEISFMHKHNLNEEIYICIAGAGELQLNDDLIGLKEGSVVRVSSETARAIRNTSTVSFSFIVIQAREGSYKGSAISDGVKVDQVPIWNK